MRAVLLTWPSTGVPQHSAAMTEPWIGQPQTRPRYRAECPLLWRAPGVAQLGEGRLHQILPMTTTEARWLLGLDGLRTVRQLMAELPENGPSPSAARGLLEVAARIGAIDDAGAMPEVWRLVSTHERTAAQADHAAALLALGSSRLADQALDQRLRTHYAITVGGKVAPDSQFTAMLHLAMQAAGLTPAFESAKAQLELVLGSHPVIGVELAALELDRPTGAHLFIAAYGDRAVVGPLVEPGLTSCLRCAYLHTRDADPSWAGVSLQLHAAISRLPRLPIDRLLATMAAAQAGRLVRAWVDRTLVVTRWRDLAIEIRLPDGAMHEEPRPAHPLCDCQWVNEAMVAG